MRIPRFFTDQALHPELEVVLERNLSHYICTVLRLKEGAPIVLFNGNGCDFPAQVAQLHKKQCTAFIDAQISLHVESPLSIHLAQGVSKGDRMDFALQKAVELGVTEVTPVITEFCNVKLNEERWAKKHEQWLKIMIAACEQSQRNILPTLHQPVVFSRFIGQQYNKKKLILAPGSQHYLSSVIRSESGYLLLIGPEGGFSDQEIYTAEQVGYTSVNMGPRILRTETAALASIAVLQALHGDL